MLLNLGSASVHYYRFYPDVLHQYEVAHEIRKICTATLPPYLTTTFCRERPLCRKGLDQYFSPLDELFMKKLLSEKGNII